MGLFFSISALVYETKELPLPKVIYPLQLTLAIILKVKTVTFSVLRYGATSPLKKLAHQKPTDNDGDDIRLIVKGCPVRFSKQNEFSSFHGIFKMTFKKFTIKHVVKEISFFSLNIFSCAQQQITTKRDQEKSLNLLHFDRLFNC